jgi:hypothetical protein
MFLKRKIILWLLFSVTSFSGYSQLYIGPVAGVQVSRFSLFERPVREKYKSIPIPGFNVGVMASMKVRDHFFLYGSLVFSERGKLMKGKEDLLYQNTSYLRYIELPLYYTYELVEKSHKYVGKGGHVKSYKIFIGGGPTIAYWLGGSGKLKSSNLKENKIEQLPYQIIFSHEDTDLNEEEYGNKMNVSDPNRFQFGINVTVGAAFEPARNQKLIAAVHLELGQTFLSRSTDGFFPKTFVDQDPLRGKVQSLRMSVSYLLDTKFSERSKGKSISDRTNKRKRK